MKHKNIFGYYWHDRNWATIYKKHSYGIEAVYDKAVTYETYKRNLRKWRKDG